MTTQSAYAAIQTEIDATQGAPEWVQIFPKGPEIAARDGRAWKLSDPARVLEAFAAYNGMLPIDWEHANDDKAQKFDRRPAAGWIAELAARDDGLWARVQWSDQGAADVAGLSYRYLSPSFTFHKKTREILAISGAGLVNHPALEMRAIASIDTGGPVMDEAIRAALGLDEAATASDAVSAIDALKATATASATAGFDPEAFVPRADYDAAIASLDDYRQRDAAAAEQALDDAVDAAVAARKITPAAKSTWRDAAGAMGLDKFNELMAAQAAIIPGTSTATTRAATPTKRTADATEAAIAAAFGYTPDQLSEEAR